MTKVRLAFTMLGTSDIERAIAFYSNVLGLKVTARFGEFVLFDTGETTLALTSELASPDAQARTHECVFGVDSVAAAFESLRDRVTFVNEPRPVNAENWAVNFSDPDGHSCSFYGAR